MGILDLFERTKSNEQIKQEIEEDDEQNYKEHKIMCCVEADNYKIKHKEIIEHHLKKPVSEVSLKELLEVGFISNHLTRKHLEEIENG